MLPRAQWSACIKLYWFSAAIQLQATAMVNQTQAVNNSLKIQALERSDS
jgi:hypothetical protein